MLGEGWERSSCRARSLFKKSGRAAQPNTKVVLYRTVGTHPVCAVVLASEMSKRSRNVAFKEEVDISDKKLKGEYADENGAGGEDDAERSKCAIFGVLPLGSHHYTFRSQNLVLKRSILWTVTRKMM